MGAWSWRDVSISKKLYFIVGLMASLLVCELLTLRFAMQTLSAARAFVGGEGLWSKSQKNAEVRLQKYWHTRDEADFAAFLEDLKIPEGDHQARLELLNPSPNLAVVRQGFLQGRIDPGDIDGMISLLRRFYWISYLSRAIDAWTRADDLLAQFKRAGLDLHSAVVAADDSRGAAVLAELVELNDRLTSLEDDFSFALGAGSRWLETVLLSLLAIAVLIVETVGLTATFVINRHISRGLRELNEAAVQIGRGDLSKTVTPRSRDEIGQLGLSLNQMGLLLRESYSELEARVAARTLALAKEVAVRKEFMSITSHELRTPLTTLKLQNGIAKRLLAQAPGVELPEKLGKALEVSGRQLDRLTRLVDELFDVTRIQSGKLAFTFEEVSLSDLATEVAGRFADQFAKVGTTLTAEIEPGIVGVVDRMRIEQVLDNLLVNAIRYAPGAPVTLRLSATDQLATIAVKDQGQGISPDRQAEVFRPFEQAASSGVARGLGLGLYIAREIALGHGGTIRIESNAGQGAHFFVDVPISGKEACGRNAVSVGATVG